MLLLRVIGAVVRALVSKEADLVTENLDLRHHRHEKAAGCQPAASNSETMTCGSPDDQGFEPLFGFETGCIW
jgi:hypothetical protein